MDITQRIFIMSQGTKAKITECEREHINATTPEVKLAYSTIKDVHISSLIGLNAQISELILSTINVVPK